jgi:hypothetical protein
MFLGPSAVIYYTRGEGPDAPGVRVTPFLQGANPASNPVGFALKFQWGCRVQGTPARIAEDDRRIEGVEGLLLRRRGLPESGCFAPSLRRAPRCDPCARHSPAPLPRRPVSSFLGAIRCSLFPGCVRAWVFSGSGDLEVPHHGMVRRRTVWAQSLL